MNKLIDIDNCEIFNYYPGDLRIYNNKLIEKCGLFVISFDGNYYGLKNMNEWTTMNEKEFFDSIKVGSLLKTFGSENDTINKIKEKFYEVNLIQIVDNFHYYLIESPTMTKPARKNSSGN